MTKTDIEKMHQLWTEAYPDVFEPLRMKLIHRCQNPYAYIDPDEEKKKEFGKTTAGWNLWNNRPNRTKAGSTIECECGQDKTDPNSDTWQHSDWCPKYKPRPGQSR